VNKRSKNVTNDPGISIAESLAEVDRAKIDSQHANSAKLKGAADAVLSSRPEDPWANPSNIRAVIRPMAAADVTGMKASELATQFEREGTDYDISRKAEVPITEAVWRHERNAEDARLAEIGELATVHVLPVNQPGSRPANYIQESPEANTAS